MSDILRDTQVPETSRVRNAQADVDMINQTLFDLGTETAKLAASSSPIGGQLIDGASAIANISAGNYGAAFLDGLGMIPLGGDALKGAIRGTSLAKAALRAKKRLDAAQAVLSRARHVAKTRAAAKRYWRGIKGRRNAILKKYDGCTVEQCKLRDAELRGVSRLPKTKGTWVDANGKPVPAGSGFWKPDPNSSLETALRKHQNPIKGVPFKDGAPDFSGFPPNSMGGKMHQVEIEMSGTSAKDIQAARKALKEQTGVSTPKTGGDGTWHHEPDGVTMSYIDKDIHTAFKKADGTANSGTPHMGGDSMTKDPEF